MPSHMKTPTKQQFLEASRNYRANAAVFWRNKKLLLFFVWLLMHCCHISLGTHKMSGWQGQRDSILESEDSSLRGEKCSKKAKAAGVSEGQKLLYLTSPSTRAMPEMNRPCAQVTGGRQGYSSPSLPHPRVSTRRSCRQQVSNKSTLERLIMPHHIPRCFSSGAWIGSKCSHCDTSSNFG